MGFDNCLWVVGSCLIFGFAGKQELFFFIKTDVTNYRKPVEQMQQSGYGAELGVGGGLAEFFVSCKGQMTCS